MRDNFYFNHDYHSREDAKILRLRAIFGMEGYGIFWSVVEMLAEEKGYLLLSDSSVIGLATGKKMEEIDEFLKWCFDLGLFKKDSKRFWSERILQHRDFREERSRSGKRGAEAKHHSSAISSAKVEPLAVKESKGKDSKEKTYTVRSETESLYSSIEEMCSQYSLDFSVNKKSLDILVERYLGKIHMKVEVDRKSVV